MKISCHEQLEAIDPYFIDVFKEAECASFDLSYSWFSNLISTTLKPGDRVNIISAEDDSGKLVVLPMRYEEKAGGARKIHALVNCYTSLYSPLGSGCGSHSLLAQALRGLLEAGPDWDIVDFSPLATDAHSFDALHQALRSVGFLPFKYFCFGNWYLPVNGRSYAEYHKSLPSRLQNTIKRKTSHFLSTGAAHLVIITDEDDIEQGIADYSKVYSTSWKKQEPFPDFIPGLIRMGAHQGWLRLGLAYFHEQPVAAQIWMVSHGHAAIFKLAYDEDFASYSAGTILSAHMMRHALDVDKVEEVDYLIGDDAYKKDWMSHRRERWGIVAYNPHTIVGLAGAATQTLSCIRRKLVSYGNHS
ncbi:MAG: GNAT family N-acetyltransferase [Candidatus Methylumidiphilus sp.]